MTKKMSDKMVTIKDIANLCGVSISTVSNVLNGKNHKVSESVATKIRDAVDQLGYKPNYIAKNLRASSTRTIGIIAEDLIQFSIPAIIEGIMGCCEEQGYDVIIENMRLFGRWHGAWLNDDALFQSALQPVLTKMEASNVDGIIYVAGHEHLVKNLKSTRELPIVMVYSIPEDSSIVSYRLDDVEGGYCAFKHLLSKGHDKIGVIGGEPNNNHTINRMIGVQKAMFEAGKLFDPDMVEYRRWTKEGGYEGIKSLLRKEKDLTAVFCMSDIIAAGAYAYLREVGLVVGKDISIIGYDNHEISSFISPQMSTIYLPLLEMGAQSSNMLFTLMQNPETELEEKEVKMCPGLIERNSVFENVLA